MKGCESTVKVPQDRVEGPVMSGALHKYVNKLCADFLFSLVFFWPPYKFRYKEKGEELHSMGLLLKKLLY